MGVFLAGLWAKVQGYFWAAVAIAGAVGAAVLYGREKGEQSQQAKTQNAEAEVEEAKQTEQTVESRNETDQNVERLPDAPAQTVGTADPATAAGKLRDGGFTRD